MGMRATAHLIQKFGEGQQRIEGNAVRLDVLSAILFLAVYQDDHTFDHETGLSGTFDRLYGGAASRHHIVHNQGSLAGLDATCNQRSVTMAFRFFAYDERADF